MSAFFGPPEPLTPRERRLTQFSPTTRDKVRKLIELSPVLEESIFDIAESAMEDGIEIGEEE
jgi:hypothetical protein